MNELYKALLYCGAFCFVLLFFLNWVGEGSDFDFHYAKAQGKDVCYPIYGFGQCDAYPPAFHVLASPFAGSEWTFKAFIVFLLGFIIPFLLFLIARKAIVVLLYYSTSFFYMFVSGTYPNALMLAVFLLFFIDYGKFKFFAWFAWLGLVYLAPSIHSWALPLFTFVFLYKTVAWVKEKNPLLSCSPFWGKTPTQLEQPLPWFDAGNSAQSLTLNNLGSFLLKGCPFPYLWFGLKKIWLEKNWLKILLIGGATATALVNYRTLFIIPLLVLPEIVDLKYWWFKPIVCILIVFQFYQFITLNLWC